MPCDYKKYPPNWLSEIRPRILARAENKCEICRVKNHETIIRGMWNGEPVFQDMDGWIYHAETGEQIGGDYLGEVDPDCKNETIKVVLTIAHLDHDPENWEVTDDRLMALCQYHHFNMDRDRNTQKKAVRKYERSLFPFNL